MFEAAKTHGIRACERGLHILDIIEKSGRGNALLRAQGVSLGKADFDGLSAYLEGFSFQN